MEYTSLKMTEKETVSAGCLKVSKRLGGGLPTFLQGLLLIAPESMALITIEDA
jgi:hypothetical protein